jgi:hypothetical protein
VLVVGRVGLGRVEHHVAGHLLGLLDLHLCPGFGIGDDLALLGQDPGQDPIALQPCRLGVAELRDQDEKVSGGLG